MAWDPVPWFIGGDIDGGARHSPEITRMMAYYLMGKQQGVLSALDLRVTSLPTPGAGYRVHPGSSSVLSVWQPLQSYVNRMPSATDEEGGPKTPTSATRSDLVVVNIKDPFAPGSPWDPPADRNFGPYIETTLITDVPPTTTKFEQLGITSWSAMELARIDMPENTETIQDSYIKDLRTIANPVTGPEPSPTDPLDPTSASPWFTEASRCVSGSVKAWDDDTYTNWPAEANWEVPIPEWANGADIFVQLNPLIAGNAWGNIRLNIGGSLGNASLYDMNYLNSGGPERFIMWHSGTQPIPADIRGTVASVKVEVKSLAFTTDAGDMTADENSYVYVSLHFKQKPVYT